MVRNLIIDIILYCSGEKIFSLIEDGIILHHMMYSQTHGTPESYFWRGRDIYQYKKFTYVFSILDYYYLIGFGNVVRDIIYVLFEYTAVIFHMITV